MATVFHYGPYASVSAPPGSLPPGAEHNWSFGPWPWYGYAVIITAHPLFLAGLDRKLAVTSISSGVSPSGDRYVHCTVRNVGRDAANYAVWLGGVAP